MQKLVFSIATINDIRDLNSLVNSAYRGDESKKGWTTEADYLDGIRTDEEGLRELIEKAGACILKCSDEESRLVGSVYLEKQNDQLYLGMLTVSPYRQARGIGRALMKQAEEFASTHNCRSIIISVISLRKELIGWYERQGFFLTGETKPFPADPRNGIPKQPLEFVVMQKNLSGSLFPRNNQP